MGGCKSIYEIHKFFCDTENAHGTRKAFLAWLKGRGEEQAVRFHEMIDPIKGGRFIREHKCNLYFYCLWNLMNEYMENSDKNIFLADGFPRS